MFNWLWKKRHPLELEAERAANAIQSALTRMNKAYHVKVRGQADHIQKVQFVEPLIATPTEIRIEVDASRLPRGVTITDLQTKDVLETLSAVCHKPVTSERKKDRGGFWYVVELQERVSIPRRVKFTDMVLPDKAAPLMLPLGVTHNGTQVWQDLRTMPHLLVAGATGQGKSVMINTLVCQLCQRIPPERLHLYMCDLKGGVELSFYKDLPHVKQFVKKNTDFPAMLLDVQTEMDRRTELMEGKARDIEGYNYQVGAAASLPYILVVIDEIANAMLATKTKVELPGMRPASVAAFTESLLADIAARARATGIHLIISTQRPSVDVVTGLIKANFPCRIAFGTSSEIDSRVIIDDGSAAGLPVGRMKFRRNMELLDIQGPYLSDDQVQKTVKHICANGTETEPAPESASDKQKRIAVFLLDIARADLGGRFPISTLFKHEEVKKAGITREEIEAIAEGLEKGKVLRPAVGGRARMIAPEHLANAVKPKDSRSTVNREKVQQGVPIRFPEPIEIGEIISDDIPIPDTFLRAFTKTAAPPAEEPPAEEVAPDE